MAEDHEMSPLASMTLGVRFGHQPVGLRVVAQFTNTTWLVLTLSDHVSELHLLYNIYIY